MGPFLNAQLDAIQEILRSPTADQFFAGRQMKNLLAASNFDVLCSLPDGSPAVLCAEDGYVYVRHVNHHEPLIP
jgi:hypothetical protein